MHNAKEDEGLFYWLEGKILQRVTKASRTKRLKYAENYFNIGELRVISENIMNAHMAASLIPDPYTSPVAALKVLRGHYEVLEHL